MGPRVDWDETEEGRPAPECAHGLWPNSSRWQPEHGQPDASGYLIPPPGTRCIGCAEELGPYPELVEQGCGGAGCRGAGQHYHCGNCAAFLDD